MVGVFYSLLAGIVIALQGVFNTRVSEKAGFWLTNAFVHGTGFVLSLVLLALLRDGSAHPMKQLLLVPRGYLLGGVLGVVIVFSVMKAIGQLGPTYSVAILLISQLAFALVIDSFGLFGVSPVPFAWNKAFGLIVMVAGIVIFKWSK